MADTGMTRKEVVHLAGVDLIDRAEQIEQLTATQNQKRADFIALVGEGVTEEIGNRGKIQVTKRTEDRSAPNLTPVFNVDTFLALPQAKQADLVKCGIVSFEQKTIKGSAPIVRILKK